MRSLLLVKHSLQIQPRVIAMLWPCSSQSTILLYPNTLLGKRNKRMLSFPRASGHCSKSVPRFWWLRISLYSFISQWKHAPKKKPQDEDTVNFTKHLGVLVGHLRKVERLPTKFGGSNPTATTLDLGLISDSCPGWLGRGSQWYVLSCENSAKWVVTSWVRSEKSSCDRNNGCDGLVRLGVGHRDEGRPMEGQKENFLLYPSAWSPVN